MDNHSLLKTVQIISGADLLGAANLNGEQVLILLYSKELDLDFIDEKVCSASFFLNEQGFKSIPVKAAQEGSVDLRNLGVRSGLGFLGRNWLLINPDFGPRLRLSAIKTNAPFPLNGKKIKSLCRKCRLCLDGCPTGALGKKDARRCLQSYRDGTAGQCKICIDICPIGRD